MSKRTAIIIGAGPAGLTAAFELLQRSDITPIIFEATGDIGGISKTVNYKGNRIDIGGHRFFSKSDRVMQWWHSIMPTQGMPAKDDIVLGRTVQLSTEPGAPDPEKADRAMLIRSRISRIFFLKKFFDYPISLARRTFANLGLIRVIKIVASYAWAVLFPIRNEKSLEDFLINRFGRELYLTFFKDYTEKVWGIPCEKISPEWGAQRIRGISISKALRHAIRRAFGLDRSKNVEASLIEQFLYPKFGPGQMWEEVAHIIEQRGGSINLNHSVVGLGVSGGRVTGVDVRDNAGGETKTYHADYFFSTMPVKDLIAAIGEPSVPAQIRRIADGLMYRDFITVGLLLERLLAKNETNIKTINDIIPDCWLYIQEREVKVGRLQVFNNWSPYMVRDDRFVWVGLEYFCNEGDALWSMGDGHFIAFATKELASTGIIDEKDVLDSTLIRMPKTYPAYFGTYDEFSEVRDFVDRLENLFLIGRNGMHKYNNMDHSMLTAMVAVDNIVSGVKSKDNIWAVNTEALYHEQNEKKP